MGRPILLNSVGDDNELFQGTKGAGPKIKQHLKQRTFERFDAILHPIRLNPLSKNRAMLKKGITRKMPMNSKVITSKVNAGQVFLYRRVSTKAQAKDEYQHQLRCIKSKYPRFSIAGSTIDTITEVVSGCRDAEIRMASGLGKCLKLLKRHPHTILLVSNADRIARRTDIFLLIQKQGFGQRIYDASTSMSLDDIIQAGLHFDIEKQTEARRASRQTERDQRRALGVPLGSTNIAKYSRHGALKKKQLADEREAKILSVINRLVYQSRGKRPSRSEICDELNGHDIHTGQGRFWTPERLSQLMKKSAHKWRKAFVSYRRRMRRNRYIIKVTQIEIRNRRVRQTSMRRLLKRTRPRLIRNINGIDTLMCTSHHPAWQTHYAGKCICKDGCRGPPDAYEHDFIFGCSAYLPRTFSIILMAHLKTADTPISRISGFRRIALRRQRRLNNACFTSTKLPCHRLSLGRHTTSPSASCDPFKP